MCVGRYADMFFCFFSMFLCRYAYMLFSYIHVLYLRKYTHIISCLYVDISLCWHVSISRCFYVGMFYVVMSLWRNGGMACCYVLCFIWWVIDVSLNCYFLNYLFHFFVLISLFGLTILLPYPISWIYLVFTNPLLFFSLFHPGYRNKRDDLFSCCVQFSILQLIYALIHCVFCLGCLSLFICPYVVMWLCHPFRLIFICNMLLFFWSFSLSERLCCCADMLLFWYAVVLTLQEYGDMEWHVMFPVPFLFIIEYALMLLCRHADMTNMLSILISFLPSHQPYSYVYICLCLYATLSLSFLNKRLYDMRL